jgi:hypothetical protein
MRFESIWSGAAVIAIAAYIHSDCFGKKLVVNGKSLNRDDRDQCHELTPHDLSERLGGRVL